MLIATPFFAPLGITVLRAGIPPNFTERLLGQLFYPRPVLYKYTKVNLNSCLFIVVKKPGPPIVTRPVLNLRLNYIVLWPESDARLGDVSLRKTLCGKPGKKGLPWTCIMILALSW